MELWAVNLQKTLIILSILSLASRSWGRYAAPFFLILAAGVDLAAIFGSFYGDDFLTWCEAVTVLSSGMDPYIQENIWKLHGNSLPFVYPPLTAFLFKPLCPAPGITFPALYLLCGAGTVFLYRKYGMADLLFLSALITTGFAGFHHNFRQGNMGMVELLMLAVLITALMKKNFRISGAVLGIWCFFKLLPIVYGIGILFTRYGRDKKTVLKFFTSAGAAFVLLTLISMVVYPQVFISYVKQLLGFINSSSPQISDMGAGYHNPSFIMAVQSWVKTNIGGYFTDIILTGAVALFLYRMLDRVSRWRDGDPLVVFSFSLLILSLLMPRFKPYTITLMALPVFLITLDYPWKQRATILVTACCLPMLWILGVFSLPGFFGVFSATYQSTFLFLTVLIIYWIEAGRSARSEGDTECPVSDG